MHQTGVGAISKAGFKGVYSFEQWRDGGLVLAWEETNLIPEQGLNSVLGVYCHADAQITSWFMALSSGVYVPNDTDTAANIVARATEITGYAEATRRGVTFAAAAAKSITNSAARATFTMNTSTTVNGAFISSVATKSAITGTLLSSLAATTPRAVISGDQILATFTLTAASV